MMGATAITLATVVSVLPAVENTTGNPAAIGDRHLAYHAVGNYQIRQPYLDDVNKLCRKDVVRAWGRLLTINDMKDPAKARWVAMKYLELWGRHYQRQTGKAPTVEVYARIHNGGPFGWKNPSTLHYWQEHFKPQLDKHNRRLVRR